MKNCHSCDIELTGDVLLAHGRAYCCSGCAAGGPCTCTYEGEQKVHSSNGHADPVLTRELLGFGGGFVDGE